MAENPLLPNRRLKALYALIQRCRALERAHRARTGTVREALLAATTIHLLPGDVVCGEPGDATVEELAPTALPPANKNAAVKPDEDITLPALSRFWLCAGIARGLRAAGTDGVVMAFANAGTPEPGWAETLAYAQAARLPLLVICVDDLTGRRKLPASAMSWTTVNAVAGKLMVPVMSVDGEDAVAVYRVLQESILRARVADGPAVVWCHMTPGGAASLSRSAQPVGRMQTYLAVRGLLK